MNLLFICDSEKFDRYLRLKTDPTDLFLTKKKDREKSGKIRKEEPLHLESGWSRKARMPAELPTA